MRNKKILILAVLCLVLSIGIAQAADTQIQASGKGKVTVQGDVFNADGDVTVTKNYGLSIEEYKAEKEKDREALLQEILPKSVKYNQLLAEIKYAKKLLGGIAPERIDLRLEQSTKVEELKKRLEDFKADVFGLYEQLNSIPINTERRRQAKALFKQGNFLEADAVLKAEEIERDVEQRKARHAAAMETVAAMDRDLADLAKDFLFKAQLSLLIPVKEGEDRFKRTEHWFEQALSTARTAEVLVEYAGFLYKQNAFSRAEPLCQEALQLLRSKAEAAPNAFLPQVAGTLNNLAGLHSETGNYGPALAELEESLKFYLALAWKEPDAFLPYVAGTLHNIANLHKKTGKHGFALVELEYEEVLKLYSSFAKSKPRAFLPQVAETLNNLAILHDDNLRNYGSALAEYEEALKIRRGLAQEEPDAFLPKVADTLNNLANLHQKTGKHSTALAEYKEALKIKRGLAQEEPDAFLPDVAGTLNNLATLHQKTGKHGTALAEYEESLKIWRGLAQEEPDTFMPYVATTLNNLAKLHKDTGNDGLAQAEHEEALKIRLFPGAAGVIGISITVPDEAKSMLEANRTKPTP